MTTEIPSAVGETVVIYWTGQNVFADGPFGSLPPDGTASPSSPLTQCQPVFNPIAQIGTVSAPVSFCGLTPGLVSLAQLNVVVPSSLTTGTYNLQMGFSSKRTSNIVALAVR
jgi:uncharacterized protein (TIGR03437 family)